MSLSLRPQKHGPVPRAGLQRYNVILERDLAEWGKRKPGGLSALLRHLLRLSYTRDGRRRSQPNPRRRPGE